MLATIMIIVHVCVAAALIYMVITQMTRFSELGGAFGSGALHTVFGRKKGLDTGGKITLVLGAVFFITSILTAYIMVK